jgi:cell division protein FtsQ
LARTRAPSRKTKPSGDEAGLWDSPRALTMIADCILLIAAAALGYALVITFTRMPVMPLNTVLIKSAPTNVTTAQIEDAARRSITGNFLTTDVDVVRAPCFEQGALGAPRHRAPDLAEPSGRVDRRASPARSVGRTAGC